MQGGDWWTQNDHFLYNGIKHGSFFQFDIEVHHSKVDVDDGTAKLSAVIDRVD